MKRKTESMMDHVPEHDMDKLKFILEVKDAYNSGSITLEEGRRRLRERVDSIKPYEVALAEQELEEFEEGQCQKEDIQSMLALFEGLIDRSRPELPANTQRTTSWRRSACPSRILSSILPSRTSGSAYTIG